MGRPERQLALLHTATPSRPAAAAALTAPSSRSPTSGTSTAIAVGKAPQHSAEPKWRNWQTRRIQNPLSERACGFESHLRYHTTLRRTRRPRPALVVRNSELSGGQRYERQRRMDNDTRQKIARLVQNPRFPRAARYDPDLILEADMGPNPLWLAEWLAKEMQPQAGMRVLDLGCGKGLTSVFWAKEFDTQVVAADLWVSVDEVFARVSAVGEAHRVIPVHAEAHSLPFPERFFDAIISVDAYQYFGTDVLYLHYLSRFLKPGGRLGFVVPGLMQALPEGRVPPHLREPQSHGCPFWEDECVSFKTAEWWKALARECSRIEVSCADTLQDGWQLWRDYDDALDLFGRRKFPSNAEALSKDGGRYIGFVRLVARRTEAVGPNLYDPALEAKVSADLARD